MTPIELETLLNTHTPGGVGLLTMEDALAYSAHAWDSYLANWVGYNTPRDQHPLTRLSQIGLPVWVQALRMPHIQALLGNTGPADEGEWSQKECIMHRRFHFGNTLEHETIMLLKAHGFKITDTQTELVFDKEHQVVGHSDGVLHIEGRRYVFDVKTMSDWSFAGYTGNKGPHDNSGYISQLACYHEVLDTDGAFLLCYNKNTHKYAVRVLLPDELESKAKRAHRVIELLAGVNTLSDVDKLPKPPAVPATWYNKEVPGIWVPHPTMEYHHERHLLWHIEQGKINPRSRERDIVVGTHDTIEDALAWHTNPDT